MQYVLDGQQRITSLFAAFLGAHIKNEGEKRITDYNDIYVNLDVDIKEENNVASDHPDVIERMRVMMKREHTPATIDRFKLEALGDTD